ncbi:MAG: LysR family transcriptional regulator [Gemmatimonadaceae bacterium]|jgi:LysR family transcriptional activator of nhaA|nr:LysR family transcriptional regulator [Gemmatimonadaceae bacterium]
MQTRDLNYHHLHLFRTVARTGSLARAAAELHLTEPTISTQVKALEQHFGHQLFARTGRRMQLTDAGQTALRYADDIFSLGDELQRALAGGETSGPRRFVVGIADVVPKLIAYRLIEPALRIEEPVHLVCTDDTPERLLAGLAVHALDLVLTDAPVTPAANVRAHNHLLGECGTTVFGSADLALRYRRNFPGSLDGAPFWLPTTNSLLRRELDTWFQQNDLRPIVRGEFADSALLKVFGQEGLALFCAPSVLEKEVQRIYQAKVVGRIPDVQERFYAIAAERTIPHPAVAAIARAARTKLFG